MGDNMRISRPTIDDAFLDQVVSSVAGAEGLIAQLRRLSGDVREQLMSRDRDEARRAASELMRTYFGVEVK